MNHPAPFANHPAKPQVTRLPDGRIGVFMGSAYQFTDDAGARSLRDQIDELLPATTAREHYEKAEHDFLGILNRELESIECGGCAPPVLATPKASA